MVYSPFDYVLLLGRGGNRPCIKIHRDPLFGLLPRRSIHAVLSALLAGTGRLFHTTTSAAYRAARALYSGPATVPHAVHCIAGTTFRWKLSSS